MTVRISDQQEAEFRLEGLPLQGTMVSGEDEEEDFQLWPLDLRIVNQEQFHKHILGPAPTLSSFCTVYNPKVIARVLRECFEHRNTLMAAQAGPTV